MLKVRVIPTLLWKNMGLVKGVGFDSWRRVGALMPAIKVYNMRDVDELVLLDITAGVEGRLPDLEMVAEAAGECFVPLTVGGGVDSVVAFRKLLLAGADKVVVNSAAYDDPTLVERAAARFGAQCVVVSIDSRREADGSYCCYRRAGTEATGKDPVSWAREVESRGAGEILITSVERDGTMEGYDIELIRSVTKAVSIPVIAAGGAGSYAHMAEALKSGGASAVAAASIYHFTEQTPREAKEYLTAEGIPVRDSAVGGC